MVNIHVRQYRTSLAALAIVVGVICAFGWWVFGDSKPSRLLRSRLTLVIDTPEGERLGSSVTQTKIRFLGGLIKGLGYDTNIDLRGEAVVVDLGKRGLLFATFESNSGLARGGMDQYNAAFAPFPRGKYGLISRSSTDEFPAYIDNLLRLKPSGQLSPSELPILVRFRDPSDSASVELVDPLNLAASFGPGVALKSAVVEITNDPITKGIETKLPWLTSRKATDNPPLFLPKLGIQTMAETPLIQQLRYWDLRQL